MSGEFTESLQEGGEYIKKARGDPSAYYSFFGTANYTNIFSGSSWPFRISNISKRFVNVNIVINL